MDADDDVRHQHPWPETPSGVNGCACQRDPSEAVSLAPALTGGSAAKPLRKRGSCPSGNSFAFRGPSDPVSPPTALRSGTWTDAFAVCNHLGLAHAQETAVTSTSLRSAKVEAIKIHHLVPRSHKVTHEHLLRVVTCVDFREGSELGVRTEGKVDGGAGPLELA